MANAPVQSCWHLPEKFHIEKTSESSVLLREQLRRFLFFTSGYHHL